MKIAYCSKCTIGEDAGPSHAITGRQRVARAVAGVGWLVLARSFSACRFLRSRGRWRSWRFGLEPLMSLLVALAIPIALNWVRLRVP